MKAKCIGTILAAILLLTGCAGSDPVLNSTDETTSSAVSEISEKTQPPKSSKYPPFTGIDISEKSVAEFSTLNNKMDYPQIFCCGEDIVYFSNPNDGLKLYSYDGEKTECLSDIQAFSLNYYDGSVYFLSSDAPINLDSTTDVYGALYKYDAESETVSQISDTPMSNLRVDENGIYYTSEYDQSLWVYKLELQSGESERLYRGFSVQHLDGYSLVNEINEEKHGIDYFLKSDEDKIWVMSDAITLFDCVYNGIYYYRDYNDAYNLYSLNLGNGEKKLVYGGGGLSDYTFYKENMYLIISGRLYHYLQEDDLIPFESYYVSSDLKNFGPYYEKLYTGNGTMYALVSYTKNHESIFRFAELTISEQDETAALNIIG